MYRRNPGQIVSISTFNHIFAKFNIEIWPTRQQNCDRRKLAHSFLNKFSRILTNFTFFFTTILLWIYPIRSSQYKIWKTRLVNIVMDIDKSFIIFFDNFYTFVFKQCRAYNVNVSLLVVLVFNHRTQFYTLKRDRERV